MTKIYCKRNDNSLDFYLADKGTEYYMFSQKAYCGVENYFKNGVVLNNAIKHSKGKSDYMIHKTMSKLSVYIKYIEKEYGIVILNQSMRKCKYVA